MQAPIHHHRRHRIERTKSKRAVDVEGKNSFIHIPCGEEFTINIVLLLLLLDVESKLQESRGQRLAFFRL